jgi:hypothetical protein
MILLILNKLELSIAFTYDSSATNGYKLLNLNTGCRITHQKVMPVPIMQHVIDLIHKMGDNDGMPDGLKIQNHHAVVLYDFSWIVGGDYQEDEDYEEQDNEEEDDDYLEEEYDEVDPNELVDILEDSKELIASNANPVKVEEDEEQDTDAVKVKDEVQEDYEQDKPPQQEEEEVKEGINEHQALMT